MTSKDVSCAAQKGLQELKNRTLNSGSPVFATQHQNISGVIVSTSSPISSKVPIVPTAYPDPNIQVSDSVYHQNITATSQRVSFPQDYPAEAMTTETIAGIDVDRGADGGTPLKMHLSKSGLLYTLNLIRDPVVDYQEKRGVSRNEEITFVTLVTSLCTQAYTAAITILVMLWNLMPLVDGLVYFVRFFLDKMIDIVETSDNKDRAIKGAILFAELTVIFFIIFMIVGLIFMPVYQLMARLFSKVFSMVAW